MMAFQGHNISANCSDNERKELPLALRVITCLVFICVIFISVLGNSIVCFIVHQKPPMRSAINLLLANMALCHIILSTTCLPLAFTTVIAGQWMYGSLMCKISSFLHSSLVCESITVLVTISIDRYLITVRQLDKLTPSRAKHLIIISWVFSVLIALPPCFGIAEYTYFLSWSQCTLGHYVSRGGLVYIAVFFVVQFYLPAVLVTPAYLAILRNNQIHMRRIMSQPEQIAVISGSRLGLRLQHYCPIQVHVGVSLKARSFKTILILFMTYLVCWIPYSIAIIAWNVNHIMEENAVGGTLILVLSYVNCAANPIVYCWRIRKFRDACSEIIPNSVKAVTYIPQRARRRVNPASMYTSETP